MKNGDCHSTFRFPRILASLVGLVALIPGSGEKCSCGGYSSSWYSKTEIADRYDAVFWGQVVSVHIESGAAIATINVHASWKGDIETTTVQVWTPSEGTACGVGFEEGRAYLVFAKTDSRAILATNLCDPTAVHERAKCWIKWFGCPSHYYHQSDILDLVLNDQHGQ